MRRFRPVGLILLLNPPFKPVNVIAAHKDIRFAEQILKKRDRGLDAADDHLAERTF